MDENRKARLKKQAIIGIASVGVFSIAYLLWQMSHTEPEKPAAAAPPREAAPLFPQAAKETKRQENIVGELKINPPRLSSGPMTLGQGSYSASLALTAVHRPITIRQISMTMAQQLGIKVDGSRCSGKTLNVDETCTVDVMFDPADPVRVEKQIVIQAESDNSDGSRKALDSVVQFSAEAVRPPPPPERQQVAVQPNPQDTVPNPALSAYLQNRGNLGGFDNETAIGPQSPEVDSWSEAGFDRSMSTFPSDLTRVVTVDKPIPVVLKIGIDTRYANRAVAQVERDIYGGEGRLIVIPRGSTVTGSVGSSGSTGEEKVQIQWTRIMRPDGAVFSIEAYGGDAMGRPGAPSHIDNRYLERYGMSLLTTVLNVGVTLGLNGKQTVQNQPPAYGGQGSNNFGYSNNQALVQQDARAVATQQANQYLQGITADLQKEGQQIAPIRTVPPGTRLTVFPARDLYLRPINPTKQMRERMMAERATRGPGNASAPPTLPVMQPQAVPQPTQVGPAARANVTYDPITGQPIVTRSPVDRSSVLDNNGFPYLPGNMGLQPVGGVRPTTSQPLPGSAENSSVMLNGADPTGSQMRQQSAPQPQAPQRAGAALWSPLNQ